MRMGHSHRDTKVLQGNSSGENRNVKMDFVGKKNR
jgi:hypothetical protein